MTLFVRFVAALVLLAGAATANAQFAPSFDRQAAEAAFPAASDQLQARRERLGATRGISLARVPEIGIAQIASALARREPGSAFPSGSAVLLYLPQGDTLSIWLIDDRGLRAASRLPLTAGALDTAIRNLRLSLNVDGISRNRAPRLKDAVDERLEARNHFDKDLGLLSTILLPKPIVSGLRGTRHVIVVPNGAIGTVPLALMKLDRDAMLIDRMTISVSPGLADAIRPGSAWNGPAALRGALIVGNPLVGPSTRWKIPDLPGAEREAAQFAQIANRPALMGPEASKERILPLLRDASLLYFAAHGTANPVDPLSGGFLMLAADDAEAGFLRAREIQSRRLAASLAVLSACQSGLGFEHEGGVIGLARAFQLAGVPRVVMSLWSVNDRATLALMDHFQRNLVAQPPDEALRNAMLATRADYPDPAHWASFALFGSPG